MEMFADAHRCRQHSIRLWRQKRLQTCIPMWLVGDCGWLFSANFFIFLFLCCLFGCIVFVFLVVLGKHFAQETSGGLFSVFFIVATLRSAWAHASSEAARYKPKDLGQKQKSNSIPVVARIEITCFRHPNNVDECQKDLGQSRRRIHDSLGAR